MRVRLLRLPRRLVAYSQTRSLLAAALLVLTFGTRTASGQTPPPGAIPRPRAPSLRQIRAQSAGARPLGAGRGRDGHRAPGSPGEQQPPGCTSGCSCGPRHKSKVA
jgi:hypothetical protein